MPHGIRIDGSALRALRTDRLLTQQELAERCAAFAASEGDPQCGITRESISKLERGQRAPTSRTLRYLVGALRPEPEELNRLVAPAPSLEAQVAEMLKDLDATEPLVFPNVRFSDVFPSRQGRLPFADVDGLDDRLRIAL